MAESTFIVVDGLVMTTKRDRYNPTVTITDNGDHDITLIFLNKRVFSDFVSMLVDTHEDIVSYD